MAQCLRVFRFGIDPGFDHIKKENAILPQCLTPELISRYQNKNTTANKKDQINMTINLSAID